MPYWRKMPSLHKTLHDGLVKEELTMITKDMMIGEVVEKYPNAADLMANFGLHCFGCHANPYETIEAGVLSHGFSEEALNELLKELNTLEQQENSKGTITMQTQQTQVQVTENAAEEIKNMLEAQKKTGYGLKVKVIRGGCAGYMYELNFVKAASPGDTTIESRGLKLFVDPQSAPLLEGCEIDYVAGLMNAGFKVNNPNEKKACGCGSSIGF